MSYLVLARKWRPQHFEELLGQEHVTQTLKNAIERNRVAHAFLFCGPRGVGKTSTARLLAKVLMCSKSKGSKSCNTCSLCEEISKGLSTDIIEIDGASNNGVDSIRELREQAHYLPAQGKYKIYIIDEVHMLSHSAFNALLKILEEPPAYLKFIFATTEVHKIPATILSRCQRFDFRKISLKQLQNYLEDIAQKENLHIEKEALIKIAKEAQGSFRDALSLLDQLIVFAGKRITLKDLQEILGAGHEEILFELLEKIFRKEHSASLDLLLKIYREAFDVKHIFGNILECLRVLLLIKISPEIMLDNDNPLDLTDNEISHFKSLSNLVSLEELELALNIMLKSSQDMSQTFYPRLVLETALVKLLDLTKLVSLEDLIHRLEILKKPLAEKESWIKSPLPSVQIPPIFSSAPAEKGKEGWEKLVLFIKTKKPSLAAILEHGYLIQWSDHKIVLGFPKNSVFAKLLSEKENTIIFEKITSEFIQTKIILLITEISETRDSTLKSLAQKNESQLETLKKKALENKVIQDIQKVLGGKIIDVKVQTKEGN